eukprot:gb/GFBE01070576.1/.p1 GENE.gb/GFBE01070576.1/~~gb/GFBE01070576.1/.p1  ORF type:complete len:245 (+),score=53.34 gb/GFBE01070576.1/:1-735(+)
MDATWLPGRSPSVREADQASSLSFDDFSSSSGLCAARATCAKMGRTVLMMRWRSLTRRFLEASGKEKKSFLDSIAPKLNDVLFAIEKKDRFDDDELRSLLRDEKAYPIGYISTRYSNFADLVRHVGYTGIFCDNSLGDKLAKGCAKDGRYIARFAVQPREPVTWHTVCLVKEGLTVSIIDTVIQEKLEQEGILSKCSEYQFSWFEYEQLCNEAGVPLTFPCEVLGNLSNSLMFTCGTRVSNTEG